MSLSGIDVSLFMAPLVEHLLLEQARLFRASIWEILGESRWSSESTWQKLYKKHLVSLEKNFQGGILSNGESLALNRW